MRVLVDTGVFSAALSRRRRARLEQKVALMSGHQVFLAAVTLSELRYGALVAEWGDARRQQLDIAIQATTVVPVSDALLTGMAELRYMCRQIGHPLHERVHASDLWIAASAIHMARVCSPPTRSSRTRPASPSIGSDCSPHRRESSCV